MKTIYDILENLDKVEKEEIFCLFMREPIETWIEIYSYKEILPELNNAFWCELVSRSIKKQRYSVLSWEKFFHHICSTDLFPLVKECFEKECRILYDSLPWYVVPSALCCNSEISCCPFGASQKLSLILGTLNNSRSEKLKYYWLKNLGAIEINYPKEYKEEFFMFLLNNFPHTYISGKDYLEINQPHTVILDNQEYYCQNILLMQDAAEIFFLFRSIQSLKE